MTPGFDERTTISRDDDDPFAKMLFEVFDTGRPMVAKVSEDGETVTTYLDETPKPNTFSIGDRVRKQANPDCSGTVTDASIAADLYEVKWDVWRYRVLANNPYSGHELEATDAA